MEKSSFFNSINGDRKYKADSFANFFNKFIGNGVFPNPATNLQVLSNNDMTVTLKAGSAWINGYMYENTDDLILRIDVADGVLSRIDRIVIRLDFLQREIRAVIKKGQFTSVPKATDLQRDADAYELAIADVKINKGAISIMQQDITDTRLNRELCGIVHGVVDQVDTTSIFNQFQNWYSTKKSEYDKDFSSWTTAKKQAFINWFNLNTDNWTNDFTKWFGTIKNIFDGDVAGYIVNKLMGLQNELDDISGRGRTTETVKENADDIKILRTDLNGHKEIIDMQMAEKADKADLILASVNIEQIEKQLENYNSYASIKDDNGIFTVVEYRMMDTTLYMKSTLSNPDTEDNYQTMTWEFYDELGVEIINTIVWSITYDEGGDIISKEMSI